MCIFFVFCDKNIKIVNNISKNSAKLVFKSGKIENGFSRKEYELFIDPKDIKKWAFVIGQMENQKLVKDFQERKNFAYEGVEIALKYSNNWKYHIEMEIMVRNKKEQIKAKEKIFNLANELDIKLMSKADTRKFVRNIESKFGK